jgi:hypothetical protein
VKYVLIPLVLVLVHAALVIFIGTLVALSPDPETEMAWGLFFFIDFPVSLCLFEPPPTFASTLSSFAIPVFFLGTMQWGTIGIVLQIAFPAHGTAAREPNMASKERQILTVLRWAARVVGTLILLLIAAFAIGEGFPSPFHGPLAERLLFAALTTMIVGLIVAWKWEGIGGSLILGGLAFFAVVNHGVPLNSVFAPMLFAGLLNLGCGCLRSRVVGV